MALNAYILQVQRLLHDTNAQYFTTAELTDYINEARNRICKDSRCLRQIVAGMITLTSGQELYSLATLNAALQTANSGVLAGYSIIDIMGVTIYWGNTRIKLQYMPFTRFDAMMRYWQTMQSRPVAYTRMGVTNLYVGPIPDQAYVSDWDLSLIPPALVTDATPEPILEPWTGAVKYYAAYLAKFREQNMQEAANFKAMYREHILTETKAWQYRVIPDPYAK